MSGARWDEEWGCWSLGDLSEALRRCADVLGQTQDVSRVLVTVAKKPGGLVPVTVVVPDERAVKRAKRELLARSEYTVEFVGEISGTGWSAETGGCLITVERDLQDSDPALELAR